MKALPLLVVLLSVGAACIVVTTLSTGSSDSESMAQSGNPAVDRSKTSGTVNADGKPEAPKLHKTDSEWKKELTPTQYNILREAGTETAFRNPYWNNEEAGDYYCAACGQKLFSSKNKFDSGTGWPSFWEPIAKGAVLYRKDPSDGMDRVEVLCSNCGGHLGHVFDDGPKPTGQRFCMNSYAMKFVPSKNP